MSLHFQIDPRSGLPVYRQMIDQIKYYVASGALKPGHQLPSVRELAQQLSVNPTTVVKAYTELQHEEVIQLRHGKGAFVAEPGGGTSEIQKEKVVRRLARQLAVESQQIGADFGFVDRILQDEWHQLSPAMQQARDAAQR
ncbi:MAG TPA: GntR family transcriptional regulator [Verrucomicrobiae bacterium]|nr:GntR family transcriptional regulator [Verrucomicrobiae bacterium]